MSENHINIDYQFGLLFDATECIGCGNCYEACKKQNHLVTTNKDFLKDHLSDKTYTVVEEYGDTYARKMCMHCLEPACASVCPVGAFEKTELGPVLYNADKCIGCRYCMVACPFQVPAFQFEAALMPDIMKCDFCFDRQKNGELPACVEICPVEALTYGKRKDLIEVARDRIKRRPDRYVNHILGENEVGGTSWLYLAGQDFSNFDFPKLGSDQAPGVTESIQHGIFAYFIPPLALYALLGGIMWINKNKSKDEE